MFIMENFFMVPGNQTTSGHDFTHFNRLTLFQSTVNLSPLNQLIQQCYILKDIEYLLLTVFSRY